VFDTLQSPLKVVAKHAAELNREFRIRAANLKTVKMLRRTI
jgi:hypothetical protein